MFVIEGFQQANQMSCRRQHYQNVEDLVRAAEQIKYPRSQLFRYSGLGLVRHYSLHFKYIACTETYRIDRSPRDV